MTTLAKGIIITVVALVALLVIGMSVSVGVGYYGWKAAQRAGNEAAAQQDLKTIAAVEIQYYNTHNRTFGTLDQMIKEEMLASRFSGDPPVVDGYVFKLNIMPKTPGQPASYTLNADPQSASTGKKHFYIDSSDSTIHVNADQPASATDPKLDG